MLCMYLVLNSKLLDVYMQCVYNKLCYFYLVVIAPLSIVVSLLHISYRNPAEQQIYKV